MKKTGLVLEGGAMRGIFTAGVLDVFMENKITFDGAIGTSAGATFGCNIKSKQIGRTIRYNCNYCSDYRYGSFRNLIKSGNLFDEQFCYRDIPEFLDPFDTKTFKENPMEFYAVSTDMETGKAVYHKCTDGGRKDILWIQASASIPLVSNIVHIDGYRLLDGGIADSIPIRYFQKLGYRKNVIILTRPKGYVKKKNKLLLVAKLLYRDYPKFIEAFSKRHIVYNKTLSYISMLEEKGSAFVIRPKEPLDIGPMESDKRELNRVYAIGRSTAMELLEDVKNFLQKE